MSVRTLPGPVLRTPVLAADAIRRTSSMDMIRPGGLADPRLIVEGSSRDVVGAVVAATARLTAEVRYDDTRALVALRTEPARPGTGALIGRAVAGGFRAAAAATLAAGDEGGVLALLLDDLPVAVLIAGYAQALTRDLPADPRYFQSRIGLCAGWSEDGMMVGSIRAGTPIPLRLGPAAPAVQEPGPLAPVAMRRRRRIDVRPGAGQIDVQAMFRDTYADPDGLETVLHEYEVGAVLDPDGLVIREIVAEPRVLPAPECPLAARSAERLVGTGVGDLAGRVRQELRGTSTCTHLNDLLRSLAGIPALLAHRG